MNVLVCGNRNYGDEGHVRAVLDSLNGSADGPVRLVAATDQSGAPRYALRWADGRCEVARVTLDRATYGSDARTLRGQMMLDMFRPDLVLVFGKAGDEVKELVRRAKIMNIEVRNV